MNNEGMMAAAKDTLEVLRGVAQGGGPGADLSHLESMLSRMDENAMREGKLGRWLGYIQGVAVANGWLTLDQCKDINRRYAD